PGCERGGGSHFVRGGPFWPRGPLVVQRHFGAELLRERARGLRGGSKSLRGGSKSLREGSKSPRAGRRCGAGGRRGSAGERGSGAGVCAAVRFGRGDLWWCSVISAPSCSASGQGGSAGARSRSAGARSRSARARSRSARGDDAARWVAVAPRGSGGASRWGVV